MVEYLESTNLIEPAHLEGFFEGWLYPPSLETLLRLLRTSDRVVLAVEEGTGRVVGFVTALTDGILCAHIPLLEVLPEYRGQGIGTELVRRILELLRHLYMVDVVCDEELEGFYTRFGMVSGEAMMLRRYEHQAGR